METSPEFITKLFFRQVRNLTIKNRTGSKDKSFLDWQSYKKEIDFIDELLFQQAIRKQNIRNITF